MTAQECKKRADKSLLVMRHKLNSQNMCIALFIRFNLTFSRSFSETRVCKMHFQKIMQASFHIYSGRRTARLGQKSHTGASASGER